MKAGNIFLSFFQSMHWRSDHKTDCRRLLDHSEASVPILGNGKGNSLVKDKGKQS